MKLKEIKVNLWHKYVLYYCIIFIIPFILLGFLTLKSSLSRVEEEFDNNIINVLNQSQSILLSQIEDLQKIAINISKDSYLSNNMMKHDYYSSIGREMISRYASSKTIIEDIVIHYFSNDSKYYSSKGSYNDIDVLISEYYKDVNISKETLKNIFKIDNSQIISIPTNNKESFECELYYIFPLYDSNGIQYATSTFLINENELKNILPQLDTKNKNEIYITNNNNYVLLSNNENIDRRFVDSKGKMLNEVVENTTYNIKENKYCILISDFKELGLKFINIADNKYLATSLINMKMNILKLLVVLFLVGLTLIFFISYLQYIPIKKINRIINKKSLNEDNRNNLSEFENIENLIKNIIKQNEELVIKNESLYNIDKNQMLLDLIEGINQNEKKHKFVLDLEEQGKKYYIVLIKKSQITKENKRMIHNLLNIEDEMYSSFNIQIPLQDKIGILVVHKNLNTSIEESLKYIEKKLEVLGDNLYFYCGNLYDKLSEMNQSYIEAVIACDYILSDTESKYVLYKETNNYNGDIIKYPYDIEEKLEYGLKQGSKEIVNDSLRKIFEFMNYNTYYCEEIRVYSFYLVKFIIKIATQLDFPYEKIKIKELIEYKNLEEFEKNIYNLVDNINEFVLSKREKVKHKFRKNIFNDIHSSYKSHDLSLESLSQKYDYSVPYLSKMIKEETGMTFTKYIQQLRFDYIKESLVKTDLPIKEIVFGAGYYDMSNFSRKFKIVMGVTPSQYREINKSSKSLEIILE